MYSGQRHCFLTCLACATALLYPVIGKALLFEPSIGGGVEYTDNSQQSPEGQTDVIAATFLGARLAENEGRLNYGIDANLNKHNYTKGSFDNQRYFNLTGNANWLMFRDRIDWFVSNYFQQSPIRSIDNTTPNNLQNSNIFNIGANVRFPVSARQNFLIVPAYSQYYYEALTTDNKQLALNATWNYQWRRRTAIGLSFNNRKIDYTETDRFGRSPAGTVFTNVAFLINGVQRRSTYSINLGKTNVKREGGREGGGFTGSLNWLADMTSRSRFNMFVSTNLTDTSSVTLTGINDPITGNPTDVQIAVDVIRNTAFNAAYLRTDASLQTRLWWEFREIKYSDSPLNREIRTLGAQLNYPVTQHLSSGLDATYSRTRQLDTGRLDDRYYLNGHLRYRLSRKLYTAMDLTYRENDSNDLLELQSFNEFAVFVRLVYGPGDLRRPTRTRGY